jgi:L-alanine-DL-glutamate epimerase-like enolase superfamily enzyme
VELDRRGFLKAAIGAGVYAGAGIVPAASGGGQKLLELEGLSRSPIRIQSIELVRPRRTYYVRTVSSDGAVGITGVNGRLLNTLTLFRNLIVPYFTGKDARELESLVDGVYRHDSYYKYAGLPFWNAVGHVEISVFDMMGRMVGKPVWALLGRRIREAIPVYISSMSRETTPEQEVEQVAEALERTGTKATKLKVGGRMHTNAHFRERTRRLIRLARKSLGDDVTIYVDSNGSYDAAEAIEVGRMLERYGVGFFEEPCGWQEYEQTRRVADALEVTVAGGEQDTSLAQFRWMIANRVVDLVQPDLYYNGGFIRSLRVARMAQQQGMKITPHSPKSGGDAAAMLHFASVVPNLGPHQEYRASPEVREGLVQVPTGPGLGIDIDLAAIRRAKGVGPV